MCKLFEFDKKIVNTISKNKNNDKCKIVRTITNSKYCGKLEVLK